MENSYGIGVTNRYALFLNDAEDPLEVLKVQEQEKEAKKKTKLSEKENKGKTETKGKTAQVARKGIKETQNVKTLESGKSKEVPTPIDKKENQDSNKKPSQRSTDRSERNVKFAGESREERNNRRNREDRPPTAPAEFNRETRDRDGPRPDSDVRQRGRGSGRGLGRGGRSSRGSGRGYDNRGKREYDRQSGSDKTRPNYSGVKPVDKREGGGAHNWGNHRDDIEELNTSHSSEDQHDWAADKPEGESQPTVESAETKETDVAVGAGADTAEQETVPPVEEEPRELTLDEYKALKGNRQKPTYNLRKAGEGEDLTQWKKMYALKKKEGEEEEEEEEEYDVSDYPQRVGRQKHLLDIDIHFADSRRGTRGRGRGGPRGGGRGGPRGPGGPPRNSAPGSRMGGSGDARGPGSRDRGDRFDKERGDRSERDSYQPRGPKQSAPKMDDEHDFPSLG
ncbi:plasminogen activator inhibitor 1 RNA-binding protein isoform X2 [Cryptotermes secundus]|uniref:plasminogen activator inhibitor 1 RNA-binding protein isoform X2 n=1 Tax=Cryptotermes secundus TaxID=105785 RepID=UPI000CD7D328|nr:plasminogen activator inhibitor 1 RNA-binding protein isoform X2 [Cryptotermes secundus]